MSALVAKPKASNSQRYTSCLVAPHYNARKSRGAIKKKIKKKKAHQALQTHESDARQILAASQTRDGGTAEGKKAKGAKMGTFRSGRRPSYACFPAYPKANHLYAVSRRTNAGEPLPFGLTRQCECAMCATLAPSIPAGVQQARVQGQEPGGRPRLYPTQRGVQAHQLGTTTNHFVQLRPLHRIHLLSLIHG